MAAETLEAVLARADANLPDTLARLSAFLRIPSVSAQPAHDGDCRAAAAWAQAELAGLGFACSLRETAGHPVLRACHPGPGAGAPHLLYYGHYDVQPAEPLAPWSGPPFEPRLVDGRNGQRLVARGAVDDKGQVMTWLEAFRAWVDVTGGLPARLTVVLEGEEETGSVNLEAFLEAERAALAADIAVISDTGMWDVDTPALTTRLRGLVYTEITVRAAQRDLHSGLYGGSALNPVSELARLLASLHDAEGRVDLPGFYDGVRDLPAGQAAAWQALGFDEAAFLGEVGLTLPAGERGVPALQRLWARPTAEVNGVGGGYSGPGAKTVIAAEAGAKVSFRLVPGQDPAAIAAGFAAAMQTRAHPGVAVRVNVLSTGPAFEAATDSRFVAAARSALADEYGRPAVLVGSGGSIPVVESLKRVLGLDTLLMGFGLDDDQVHGPDEKFDVRCLHQGIRSHARLLAALAVPNADGQNEERRPAR